LISWESSKDESQRLYMLLLFNWFSFSYIQCYVGKNTNRTFSIGLGNYFVAISFFQGQTRPTAPTIQAEA